MADLDIAAAYLYSRRFWPCAWYEVEAEDGRLLHLAPMEDAFAVEFSAPPLATLTLSLTRDRLIPLGAGNGLALGFDGQGRGHFVRNLLACPQALEQVEPQLTAQGTLDDLAVALARPRRPDLDRSQDRLVDGQGGSNLRHLGIIAS